MSRSAELKGTTNPVVQYVKWDSNEKKFSSYRKETKEKVTIELPLELTFLKTSVTIKGWSDAHSCGIFSNQVVNTQVETFVVKAGDIKIANGLYKDIKDSVKAAGAKFTMNVYCLINGEVSVLEIKGAALMEWSEFFKRNKQKLDQNTVVIAGFNDGKKGAVKYTTPKFTTGKAIADYIKADEAYDQVKAYLSYAPDVETEGQSYVATEGLDEPDDLPF